jgi:hypothetical protein
MSSEHSKYQISATTLTKVRGYLIKQDYPAAYQAVADDLKAQARHGIAIDPNTLTWYADAAQINNPQANSFIHYFVRAYVSEYAKAQTGQEIDSAQFQNVSNLLASNVLGHISTHGVVLGFDTVGEQDTQNIIENFKNGNTIVDKFAWPAYADLAAFPWLRNFKDATWLNNLSLEQQYRILWAASQAGEDALLESRGRVLIGKTP